MKVEIEAKYSDATGAVVIVVGEHYAFCIPSNIDLHRASEEYIVQLAVARWLNDMDGLLKELAARRGG